LGAKPLTIATTARVMLPPKITDGINPSNFAVNPDSNDPNSFDDPIKMLFTEDTRPRISLGVYN
jgi:hypothetical protein